jgi:hypothetical protein
MKTVKRWLCQVIIICIIVTAVGAVSCKNSTGPGLESQRKDLIGCWELVQIDSKIGFGHKIKFGDPDSAHFIAQASLFESDSSGPKIVESTINVKFKEWINERDSIFFENGNGAEILTYPDSIQKIIEIQNLDERFSFNLDAKGLILRGHWLNGEAHAYRYSKCQQ